MYILCGNLSKPLQAKASLTPTPSSRWSTRNRSQTKDIVRDFVGKSMLRVENILMVLIESSHKTIYI